MTATATAAAPRRAPAPLSDLQFAVLQLVADVSAARDAGDPHAAGKLGAYEFRNLVTAVLGPHASGSRESMLRAGFIAPERSRTDRADTLRLTSPGLARLAAERAAGRRAPVRWADYLATSRLRTVQSQVSASRAAVAKERANWDLGVRQVAARLTDAQLDAVAQAGGSELAVALHALREAAVELAYLAEVQTRAEAAFATRTRPD